MALTNIRSNFALSLESHFEQIDITFTGVSHLIVFRCEHVSVGVTPCYLEQTFAGVRQPQCTWCTALSLFVVCIVLEMSTTIILDEHMEEQRKV